MIVIKAMYTIGYKHIYIKRFYAFIFSGLLFFACTNSQQGSTSKNIIHDTALTQKTTANITNTALSSDIHLDTFSHAPGKIIDGCSEAFATDSSLYTAGSCVFMSNLQGKGIIKLDGRFIILNAIDKEAKDSAGNDKNYVETFSGGGYTVTLNAIFLRADGEELTLYTGTLEITNGIHKTMIRIYGSLGC